MTHSFPLICVETPVEYSNRVACQGRDHPREECESNGISGRERRPTTACSGRRFAPPL